MRTMFVKLFCWFWLAMTLSGIVVFLIAFNMRIGPMHAQFERRYSVERARIVCEALALYGHTAAGIYEKYGEMATRNFVHQGEPHGMRAYLFSIDGTSLSGPAPLHLQKAVQQLLLSDLSEIVFDKGIVAAAVLVKSPRGKTYVAAAEGVPPIPPPQTLLQGWPFPPDFWFRFCVTFVIGGLVCYGLAWHLTSPVRQLRAAAQRLGTGDLTTRVSIRSKGRGDEVTDLVRDFNRMAERIEKLMLAQKQLVRDVSHELRSPLARLNVALGLARRTASPAAAAPLDRIEQEAERLNVMIGELLTLSLLESDSVRFEKESFDLTEVVDEVVRDADFEAESRNRRVTFGAAGPLKMAGSREMVRRALENVVRNAVRYTSEGTSVEVSLEESSNHAVIRVRDYGPGVPEDVLQYIFRPFYRIAEARDRQTGGTGIGLAITERAVLLHSGEVQAANAQDGGLVVELRLPLS
jgi:signal transduction histidine kinase